jgi:hypothetical protein
MVEMKNISSDGVERNRKFSAYEMYKIERRDALTLTYVNISWRTGYLLQPSALQRS